MIERPAFYTFENGVFVIVEGEDDDARELHALPEGFWDVDGQQTMDWDDGAGAIVELVSQWRDRLWTAVKAAREAAIDGGCITPLGRVDTDPGSRAAITERWTAAQADPGTWSSVWTMEDNSDEPVDHDAMRSIKLAVDAHVEAQRQRARDLRDQLNAASTVAGLKAVETF
jgi:hypothetical protein